MENTWTPEPCLKPHRKCCGYKAFWFAGVLLIFQHVAFTQHLHNFYPDTLNKKRLTGLIITETIAYSATMAGLYQLWYKNYPSSSFHFINDNQEWLLMDKAGHATTAYYLGRINYNALRWAGVKDKKAVWYGGASGLLFVTTIEVFDGFSKEWGASTGDIIANTSGALLFVSQQLLWKDQRFTLKYSFHPSEYADYNPELLGKNTLQQAIKDYNGQTFWLSANIKSFIRRDSRFPSWLNIAFGYGAEGMTGAGSNPVSIDGTPIPPSERYRQFYLSPDIDLTRIKVKSNFLKVVFTLIGFIKIPLPTLEYNKENNFVFHWVYF
ncbi:MAG: YfiM family protein [Bacteroidetes bacterium]|nr:YfiM family protein [Bacteroidota bacterium]